MSAQGCYRQLKTGPYYIPKHWATFGYLPPINEHLGGGDSQESLTEEYDG